MSSLPRPRALVPKIGPINRPNVRKYGKNCSSGAPTPWHSLTKNRKIPNCQMSLWLGKNMATTTVITDFGFPKIFKQNQLSELRKQAARQGMTMQENFPKPNGSSDYSRAERPYSFESGPS